MSNNINLLPRKRKSNQQQEIILKIVKKLSIGFLAVTIICAIVVFLLDINPSLSNLLQQKNATITNLSFTHGKVAKYLLITDRVQAIKTLLQKRTSYDTVIGVLQDQTPHDVTIDSLDITGKTLTMSASSLSLSSCDTFVNNITQLVQQKKIIKSITIDTISADQVVGKFVVSIRSDLL